MGIAVEPPIRHDLGCRDDDDRLVPLRWLRGDGITPIVIVSARLTMRFDRPDNDLWPVNPESGVPVPPAVQTHTIQTTTVDPDGWLYDDRYDEGEVIAVLDHHLWEEFDEPWRGTWELTAISAEGIQRCLVRGEFVCEKGVGA